MIPIDSPGSARGQKVDLCPLKSNKLFQDAARWSLRPPRRSRLRGMARSGRHRGRCRVSWSRVVIPSVGSPTRVEGSDAGRSMRSQAFRTAREDAMREESFQQKGSTAGCSSSWASDTGREFRHGKKHAQPSISNCERRCDACGEFPGASAIWLVRHGLKYEISKAS